VQTHAEAILQRLHAGRCLATAHGPRARRGLRTLDNAGAPA
jgi:hypothetical protein